MDDYKEKYEAALKRAKNLKEMYPQDAAGYEEVFPELRESEDERIRKALIEQTELSLLWDTYKLKKEQVLAWLEKKKERGPLTKDEEYTLHRIIEYLEDETCPSEWISLLHDIYCLPYTKQKEQKPVEYLPKQKVFDIMNKLTNLSYSERIPIESEEYVKIHEITSDVNSLLNYPIKPVEWSEEDERILTGIIERGSSQIPPFEPALKEEQMEWLMKRLKSFRPPFKDKKMKLKILKYLSTRCSVNEFEEVEDYLNNLYPQPKEEWSEEDKEYYDTIVCKLETIGDDSGLSDNQIRFLREHCPLNCSEWSEDDESFLDSIEEAISSYYDLNHAPQYHYWLEEKLKSIRPQQKQKLNFSGFVDKVGSWFANLKLDHYRKTFDGDVYPATLLVQKYDSFVNKLSEEYNEKALQWKPSEEQLNAIDFVLRFNKTGEYKQVLQCLYNDLCKFPEAWKPSKEQMEALERASTNKYLSAKQFDILVSLYEQLKAL